MHSLNDKSNLVHMQKAVACEAKNRYTRLDVKVLHLDDVDFYVN